MAEQLAIDPLYRVEKTHECCGESWVDHWDCACNDDCPVCGAEIEPTTAIDLVTGESVI